MPDFITPSDNQVSYTPTLIDELEQEHRAIAQCFAQMRAAAQKEDIHTVVTTLGQFKKKLTAHLYKENMKLYMYLQYALTSQPYDYAQMRELRKEMDKIATSSMQFMTKYQQLENNPALIKTFATDLAELNKALSMRITLEETSLFPLYQPPT